MASLIELFADVAEADVLAMVNCVQLRMFGLQFFRYSDWNRFSALHHPACGVSVTPCGVSIGPPEAAARSALGSVSGGENQVSPEWH